MPEDPNKDKRLSQPPERRRPTPRAIYEDKLPKGPRLRDRIRRGAENALFATLTVLVVSVLLEEKKPQLPPTPPPAATGPRQPGVEEKPKLSAEQESLLQKLGQIPTLFDNPASMPQVASLLDTKRSTKDHCVTAGAIAKDNMDQIATITAFLEGDPRNIEEAHLRENIQKYRARLSLTPEVIQQNLERAASLNKKDMTASAGYSFLQSCDSVSLFFFGNKMEQGIRNNKDKVAPIVAAISRGIQNNTPGAMEAGHALLQIVEHLQKGAR